MNLKIIYLFSALILPVLIFLFLKRFGKNEFDIPVFYRHSADSLNSVCKTHYSNPFILPDSVLQKIGWKKKKATVFLLSQSTNKELNRLEDNFTDAEFELLRVPSLILNENDFNGISNCVFFMTAPKDLVLVDQQKRIRGYYSSTTREEMDRLILEMEILLKKY